MLAKLNRSSLWKHVQRFSLDKALVFVGQLVLVLLLSVVTPLLLRHLFAAKFVDHSEPLEFIFQACDSEQAGVCSFPEAMILLDQSRLELLSGYYHSFSLDVSIFDTAQNRRLGVFIANIQMKDESMGVLASYNKGIPAFKSFPSKSVLRAILIKTRNAMFLPLYMLGFFRDEMAPETINVKFSNSYLEKRRNPTRFIVVQLQNKFIQISSASLRIYAHVGLLCHLTSQFPVISYLLLLTLSFACYSSIFVLYWAYKGMSSFYAYSYVCK